MKTLYIFLTRSGTLVSNLVYALTGAEYTHISLAFDENLNTLYSSTRKNGYTMFPSGAEPGIPEQGRLPAAGEHPLRALCAGSVGRGLRPRQAPRRTYDDPR